MGPSLQSKFPGFPEESSKTFPKTREIFFLGNFFPGWQPQSSQISDVTETFISMPCSERTGCTCGESASISGPTCLRIMLTYARTVQYSVGTGAMKLIPIVLLSRTALGSKRVHLVGKRFSAQLVHASQNTLYCT